MVAKSSRQANPVPVVLEKKPNQYKCLWEILVWEMLGHPFNRTSIDYFGYLTVDLSRNRPRKRYGALFTYLVTRAVNTDLAKSLSTEDFLLVLQRFLGLYGRPRCIHSDNGTNFVGAERELREVLKLREEFRGLFKVRDHRVAFPTTPRSSFWWISREFGKPTNKIL